MFQNFSRNFSTMPVSLSEWRVRIGTFVPRMPLSRYLDLTMKVFLALLNALADGEDKMDPLEKETSCTTAEHQSSSDKAPSNPKKDDTPSGVNSDEQKTPTATADQTKDRVSKGSKKRKRHNLKGHCGPGQPCAFLSFRCFLKSGASPLLRFLLLVFTTILLIRSGDVEVNPGPNERSTSVSDSALLDIAKRIPQEKLYDLGNNLGIDFSSLRRHRATNTMGGAANWTGTLDMLIEWRDNTSIQQQEELLRNALISSSLHAVAEQYLPQDPPSREEGLADMQNIPVHPAAGQSTSNGRPSMASSSPALPMNPNCGANVDMYQSSYLTTSHQYIYDASSTNQGSVHSRYQGGFHSQPNQYHSVLPGNPLAYQTQGFAGPSYEQNSYAWQSQGQTLSSMQPIDVSSSSAPQFLSHGISSAQSSLEAGAVPTRPLQNTHPNMQFSTSIVSSHPNDCLYQDPVSNSPLQVPNTWESSEQGRLTRLYNSPPAGQQHASIEQASSQAHAHSGVLHVPVMTQQEIMQYTSTPENEQGFFSASNQYQEPPYSNPSGLPASVGSSLGQTPSCGMAAAQTYPPTGPGSYPVSVQPGRSYMAPQMTSAHSYVPVMSSYHTPQEPTITHSSTAQYVHPASEIPPITDAQLEQCREDIKDFYGCNLCQVPTSPLDTDSLVELKSIFTNLILLKENRSTRKKENLAYEDLLDIKMNNLTAKRIMIQGEAGVGKTTFCAKIAWDWIEGTHYQDYAFVAIVLLRDAKNNRTVGQILKTYLSDENQVTSEQLDKYIKENQDKVLTVFDGFDEFGSEMSNDMNPIVQILNCRSIKSGTVIVTTRPWKAHEIAKRMSEAKQYAFVRIDGFKRKDVRTYVTKFYRDDNTSAQSLLEFMEEGSLITETMAPFPIFCSMLCHMWKEVERREVIRKLQTFSQLFQEMIVQLEEHYISKHATTSTSDSAPLAQDIKEKIDDHLKRISEIAFNGLLSNKLTFLEQEFESCADDLRVAYGVGILTREKTMYKREHVRKVARVDFTFSFPHKLFQEYTAAKHLQDLFSSNHDEFHRIMQYKILRKAAEFKYLLYFTGSFDKIIAKDILTRLIEVNVDLDLIVEVAFEGHSEEAASVIEEQYQDTSRSLTIEKDTSLHAVASYMFVLKQLESLCIRKMPHTKILSRNLAEKVCSLKTLKELQLEGCNITVSFSETLLQHSKEILVETFILQEVKLTKSSSINIAKCICFLPHLKNFKLFTESSMEDFLATLHSQTSQSKINIKMNVELLIAFVSFLVPSKTAKVESLEIECSKSLSESASQNLGASICSIPCLKNLKLALRLSDVFYTTLREGASSLKVESLEIKCIDQLSKSASQNLGVSMCTMPCLKNLKLLMGLSDGFYTALREGASSLKVESLEIKCIDQLISKSASQNLGVSMCTMPCLKNLKLLMGLSDGFYTALREGASSLKVKTLDIKCLGSLNESASQNLAVSICTMPCLENVKLLMVLSDGFYTTLREGASSLKVKSLEIECSNHHYQLSESASQNLVASICTMPCLKNLKLAVNLSDGFYTTLREGASSLKIEQMHLMGVGLERSDGLSAFALMQNLVSLTLYDVRISDNSKHTEEEGRDPSDTPSSTSLTELNVDHDSFISLCGMGLLKRFPHIQKMTLAFHLGQTPFPQELLHHVTMSAVMDLTLHGYSRDYERAHLASLSLVPFPNLINLSLINISIGNNHCKTILQSLRNEKTLKTISIKDCETDADLDPQINAEGKMTVTVQHGLSQYVYLEEVFRDIKIGAEDLQVMSQDDES